MARTVAIGIQNFADLRQKQCFYIDKTMFIKEWWESNDNTTLITRPRRFGKTLNITMLQEFFDIRQDSRKLFEGLEVMGHEAICDGWMNKYPTLFLSLKSIEGQSFDHALEQSAALMSRLCIEHEYLVTSPSVSVADRQELSSLIFKQGSPAMLENSLITLSRALEGRSDF